MDNIFNKCRELLENHQFKEVCGLCFDMAYSYPENICVHQLLFESLLGLGDVNSAECILSKLKSLGSSCTKEEQLLQVLKQHIEKVRKLYESRLETALSKTDLDKKYADRLKMINIALEVAPCSVPLLDLKTDCLIRTNRLAEANVIVKKMLREDSEDFSGQWTFLQGVLKYFDGKLKESLVCVSLSIEKEKNEQKYTEVPQPRQKRQCLKEKLERLLAPVTEAELLCENKCYNDAIIKYLEAIENSNGHVEWKMNLQLLLDKAYEGAGRLKNSLKRQHEGSEKTSFYQVEQLSNTLINRPSSMSISGSLDKFGDNQGDNTLLSCIVENFQMSEGKLNGSSSKSEMHKASDCCLQEETLVENLKWDQSRTSMKDKTLETEKALFQKSAKLRRIIVEKTKINLLMKLYNVGQLEEFVAQFKLVKDKQSNNWDEVKKSYEKAEKILSEAYLLFSSEV